MNRKLTQILSLSAITLALSATAASAAKQPAANTPQPKISYGNRGMLTLETGLPGAVQSATECRVVGPKRRLVVAGTVTDHKTSRGVVFNIDRHGHAIGRRGHGNPYSVIGAANSIVVTSAIDASGRVWVVTKRRSTGVLSLARTTAGNNPDLHFGDHGTVRIPFKSVPPEHAFVNFTGVAVTPLDDGGAAVAGVSQQNMSTVFRVRANGTVNTEFGNHGSIQLSDFAARAVAERMGVGPIFVGGNSISTKRAELVKLDPTNGSIDKNFGVNGVLDLGAAHEESRVDQIAVSYDGSVTLRTFHQDKVANTPYETLTIDLTRVTSSDQIDPNYGTNGSLELWQIGTGSDNMPATEGEFVDLFAADAGLVGYFQNGFDDHSWGLQYKWIDAEGHPLGQLESRDIYSTSSRFSIADVREIPGGNFYACGAVSTGDGKTYRSRIAVARFMR